MIMLQQQKEHLIATKAERPKERSKYENEMETGQKCGSDGSLGEQLFQLGDLEKYLQRKKYLKN